MKALHKPNLKLATYSLQFFFVIKILDFVSLSALTLLCDKKRKAVFLKSALYAPVNVNPRIPTGPGHSRTLAGD